jgi:hypothetical protein
MLLPNVDLKNLAKLAGLHEDPRIKPLINHPNLPKDKRYKLAKLLTAKAAIRSPEPHPYLPAPPPEQAAQGIAELGLVVTGRGPEYPFRLKENHFLSHIQVDASTGGGKTVIIILISLQVHNAGRPVWWFDTEGDITGYIVEAAPDVLVLNYKDLRQAIFEGPGLEDLDWQEYLDMLIDWLRYSLFAGDGMCNMSKGICITLRERQGFFTIHDFTEELLRRKYKLSSREGNYWEALKNRYVSGVVPALGQVYGSGSHDIRALMNRSIVWRLEGLSDDVLAFWVTVLLLWVYLVSGVTSQPGLGTLLVFDEFTRVCSGDKVKRGELNENFFFHFIRRARKRQLALMLATQTPHLLPKTVQSNTNTWIVMRPTDGHFLYCVSTALNLDQDQERCLMELPDRGPRRAVVRCPGFAEPFLVEIPEL